MNNGINRFDWKVLIRFWAIAKPYWFSNEKWGAFALLSILIILTLSVSGMNVVISYVGRDFMTALSERKEADFYRLLWSYASVFIIATPVVVFYRYVRKTLGNFWRKWLTNNFLNQYFNNRAYYEISFNASLDNPDQRIAEDVKSFTITSLSLLLTIISQIIDIFAFTGILWSISKLLVGILIAYSIIGTIITVWIGKRLVGINFNQLKKEANFRYGLIHVRDNAESIAFYRGESQESNQVINRFLEAFDNFKLLIGWQRNLDIFTTLYGYVPIILPSLVVAPLYFAKQLEFGQISQAGFAFAQVFGAFSIIVSEFENLTEFAAGIYRLETFEQFLNHPIPATQNGHTTIDQSEEKIISLKHLTLETPNYAKTLIKDLSLEIPLTQGLLIIGPSGTGKSSLLRAIAGLWNAGTGVITRPKLEEMLFLPQRPYMILGTLRDQLLYPNTDHKIPDEELLAVLQEVNLPDLAERVGGLDTELEWANVLSLGEQQRVAFARLLITKSKYVVLDEATSALDIKNEKTLYEKLRNSQATFISVGHRPTLLQYHDSVIELLGDGEWKISPTSEYRGVEWGIN